MPISQDKEMVRRYYEEIVGQGLIDRVPEYISPMYVEVHRGKRYEVGIAGAQEHIRGVRRTYPDLQLLVDRQIAEEDFVVTCLTARGTHAGEWLGIAPTGKRLEFTAVNVDRVLDGRIVEHGGAADLLGPLLDAGAVRIVGR